MRAKVMGWTAALLFCLLGGLSPAAAQPAAAYVGCWAMDLGGRNLVVLSLQPGAGGLPVSGSLMRPKHFSILAPLLSVSGVRGPVIAEAVVAAVLDAKGLRLTVANLDDPKDTDDLQLTLNSHGGADLIYLAAPDAVMALVREGPQAQVATDWDPDQSYAATPAQPTNPEMTRLFDADQAARANWATINWAVVSPDDAIRRSQVAALLKKGALHTGADYFHAAFVFQHGQKPDDYLLAHTLAMVAVSKGRRDAIWIASATLDRYLMHIGQPQIYGTQFRSDKGAPTTQEPYARDLISDALRAELGVPSLEAQEAQRAAFDKQAAAH